MINQTKLRKLLGKLSQMGLCSDVLPSASGVTESSAHEVVDATADDEAFDLYAVFLVISKTKDLESVSIEAVCGQASAEAQRIIEEKANPREALKAEISTKFAGWGIGGTLLRGAGVLLGLGGIALAARHGARHVTSHLDTEARDADRETVEGETKEGYSYFSR